MIPENLRKRIITSTILFTLLFLALNYEIILIILLLLIGILSLIEFFNLSGKIFKNKNLLFISNILFSFYIFLFCCLFFLFTGFIQLKIILFLFLIGCIASDLGGYLFGKIFGGPKLLKRISPNKTISGSIGSIIFTVSVFFVFSYYYQISFSVKIFILAMVTSISCQIGDLLISYFKRKANQKDSGNLLPGHGGLLDRFDGIFLGIPISFLIFILFFK